MRWLKATLVILLAAVPAAAGATDMKLAWSECDGAGGPHTMSFACNTNSNAQAHTLIVSFIPPPGMTAFIATEVFINISFNDPVTPSWWAIKGTGQCRNNGVVASQDFISTGPYGCTDPWQGQAVSALGSYNIAYTAPNHARMQCLFALPNYLAQSLDPNLEYYGGKILILNNKTVGTGSCTGCTSPAAFFLSSLQLDQVNGVGNVQLYSSNVENLLAGWQCPAGFSVCDGPGCGFQWFPDCATPTRTTTWGMIKAIYH